MNIDWLAFLIVAVATLVSALFVVGSYGLGVRLLAVAADAPETRRPAYRGLAYLSFAVAAVAVGYGIYLIVPAFH
ncbi:hypothetical protein [Arthrobacter sp. CAU 1506]|uniref:hypothetical protein n=1 Tax=Arthrobacter sp. CAU 1506 TaxID=2560052 RepID=UPI00197A7027|nr:hypothetical protein [Arthrobacter sp. CAU 1506]